MFGLLILLILGGIGIYLYLLGREYFLWPFFAYGMKSTRWLGLLFVFLSVDSMAVWVYSGEKNLPDALSYAKRQALVSGAAYVITKKLELPATVSEGVTLVNVIADDRRLIYTFTAQTSDARLIDAVWQAIRHDAEQIACTRADYALLLKNGIMIEHRILRDGVDVEPMFRFEPYMCSASLVNQ